MAKKTPSPKVIASMWVLDRLNTESGGDADISTSLSPDSLSEMCGSRVNEAKVEKVVEQIGKITLKFRERLEKVIEKFETPSSPTAKPSSAKAPTKGDKKTAPKKPDKKARRGNTFAVDDDD